MFTLKLIGHFISDVIKKKVINLNAFNVYYCRSNHSFYYVQLFCLNAITYTSIWIDNIYAYTYSL